MEITAIVVAVLSIIGQIILLLFQRKQSQTQVIKTEYEASSILIDRALNINKQETENLRILLDVIKTEYKEALLNIEKLENEIKKLKASIIFMEKKLKKISAILAKSGVNSEVIDQVEEEICEEEPLPETKSGG